MRPTNGVIVGCSAILILAGTLAWLLFSMPASPPLQATTATPAISDSPEQDESELEIQKTAFNEQVRSFELAFRSRDYADPAKRQEELKHFMTPEAFEELLQAERNSPILAKLAKSRATQEVLFAQVTEGEIDDDLAEATTSVIVQVMQQDSPDTRNELLSGTSWVLTNGVWLVYEVDPA